MTLDLKADKIYYEAFWKDREKAIIGIRNILYGSNEQAQPKKIITCHGFQNMSSRVLENFKNKFMTVKGYSYSDLVQMYPYEFSWYNFWLQDCKVIRVVACEPFFKTFHMKHQLLNAWDEGMSLEDLKRSYVGIVINSNYTDGKLLRFEKSAAIRAKWKIEEMICSIKGGIKRLLRGW